MTYFKDVNTLEELRKQYKELLKKYHPDNANGSTEATQEINAEYDRLFKVLKDKHESKTAAGTTQTSYDNAKYNFEEDEKIREVLQKIIHYSNITIEITGSWLWVSGNTYQHKDKLKEIGFKWANQKKCGIGIAKHLEKKEIKPCQWMILEITMEVKKYRQKKQKN